MMAKFHIKLGPTAADSEVTVNGRRMENVIGVRIQQGKDGPPAVSITIPAEELIVEGQAEIDFNEVKIA